MSLLRKLLKEFNPNQLSIDGDSNDRKIKKTLYKLKDKLTKVPVQGMKKDEVLSYLDFSHEKMVEALEDARDQFGRWDEAFDFRYYGDELMDKLRGFWKENGDKIFDWDAISGMIEYVSDEKFDPDNKDDIDKMREWVLYSEDPLIDDHDELEDAFDDETYLAMFQDDIIREYILMESDQYLDELHTAIASDTIIINNEECLPIFRAIQLDMDDDYPLSPDIGLGVYWSYNESGAIPHSGGGGTEVIIHAYIPLGGINWGATLYKTLYDLRYEEEIETHEDVDIYIEKIEIEDDDIKNKAREKADLILKTYFRKKYESIESGRERNLFLNKLQQYLEERGLVKKEFAINFKEYYKSTT